MIDLKQTKLTDGVNIFFNRTQKFKTATVSIYIHRKLEAEEVAKNALLPYVLRRGCTAFPTSQDISGYLESLYGTIFDCSVNKKGEDQILAFNFEMIHDDYTKDNMLEKVLNLAKSILFDPLVENGAFKSEYVRQEKEILKDMINGMLNNKMAYSIERCYQEMCKGEPFGNYELGSIEEVDNIQNEELFAHYQQVIKSSPIDIFISGNYEESSIHNMVNDVFKFKNEARKQYPESIIKSDVAEVKTIEEQMDITQGKLTLGFRTKTSPKDQDYYALAVYNGILGGGPHSKLFNNVREKQSLAYYAFSRIEKFKGLMIIGSGIEIENYQKALEEIKLQVEEIKKGNISDYEYEATINSAINGIRSLSDSAFQMEDYYLSQLVGGTEDNFESLIQKIQAVKKEDVVAVAQKIQLDTIYFLRSKG